MLSGLEVPGRSGEVGRELTSCGPLERVSPEGTQIVRKPVETVESDGTGAQ